MYEKKNPWDYGQQQSYLQPSYAQTQQPDVMNQTAQGAAMGGATGGLGGAAIGAGASFLNAYLQAKAAEEQQKRQMLAQAAQSRGQGEQQALSNLTQVWRGALS